MDMATYSTIGAVEADKALLEKPKASFKGLVAGAAVVSFVLGVMAAVATTPTALRGEAAFIAAPGAPGAAAKPFHFSRVVDSVAPGYGFEWTFEPAASCTSDHGHGRARMLRGRSGLGRHRGRVRQSHYAWHATHVYGLQNWLVSHGEGRALPRQDRRRV